MRPQIYLSCLAVGCMIRLASADLGTDIRSAVPPQAERFSLPLSLNTPETTSLNADFDFQEPFLPPGANVWHSESTARADRDSAHADSLLKYVGNPSLLQGYAPQATLWTHAWFSGTVTLDSGTHAPLNYDFAARFRDLQGFTGFAPFGAALHIEISVNGVIQSGDLSQNAGGLLRYGLLAGYNPGFGSEIADSTLTTQPFEWNSGDNLVRFDLSIFNAPLMITELWVDASNTLGIPRSGPFIVSTTPGLRVDSSDLGIRGNQRFAVPDQTSAKAGLLAITGILFLRRRHRQETLGAKMDVR